HEGDPTPHDTRADHRDCPHQTSSNRELFRKRAHGTRNQGTERGCRTPGRAGARLPRIDRAAGAHPPNPPHDPGIQTGSCPRGAGAASLSLHPSQNLPAGGSMILVTGATGATGSELVRLLTQKKAPVRAFVRNPEKVRSRLGPGVEIALGDFE